MKVEFDPEENKISLTAMETKSHVAKRIIVDIKNQLSQLERLLDTETDMADIEAMTRKKFDSERESILSGNDGKIVEGVFDGCHMIGSDGRQYAIPPNYASKSKLVEGDILKLSIQANGTFQFKQIGPIERQRVMGTLSKDERTSDWIVVCDGKKYCILTAAVSFHKGGEGDEAVLLIPNSTPTKWAALENVIKRTRELE